MKKLAIFDLDGTLIDTIEDLANAGNFALAKHDLPTHPVEAYKGFVGNGVHHLIERMLPPDRIGSEMVDCVKKTFDEYYAVHYLDCTKPYEGVNRLLKGLCDAGVKLAVLSNKPHRYTCELVETLFFGQFDAVFGQRDGIAHKPDPAGVYVIIESFGVDVSDTVYIGDSDVDVQTAQNAGVLCIGVEWGFRGKKELLRAGADFVAAVPEEILEILQSNPKNARKL